MSTPLGKYTSVEAVRGCLGLDHSDCPDYYLIDTDVDKELILDLEDWLPTYDAVFEAGKQASPSAEEVKAKIGLELYAQWFIAYEIAIRPMIFLQTVSDGKNQGKRFEVNLERVALLAASKKSQYRNWLDKAVNNAQDSFAEPAGLLSLSVPVYDPITDT